MAGTPRVQLSLKGRLLSEVPFEGAALRIGRMRENDIVVNNLAVSRFHATLRREGDAFVLEDLGSENGTQLNGVRISGSAPMAPADVVQLGKYELKIVMEPSKKMSSAPAKKPSDAWDASQTYLALGDPPPRTLGKGTASASAAPAAAAPASAPAQPAAPAAEPEPAFDFSANGIAPAELAPELTESDAAPDPDGVFAFGEDDLGEPEDAPSVPGPRDMETAPLAPPPEHTALFDFGTDSAPPPTQPLAPARDAAAPEPEAADERLHAGLIVQRDGKLHELRAWDTDELCAGRAPECEVVLSDAGVSRRHATFKRAAGVYEVSDLGSVNGIYVNGQRTKRHALAVGDVVRIESFELTFVLDHQPIGSEVSGPTRSSSALSQTEGETRFSLAAPVASEEEEAFELAPLAGDPVAPPELAPASDGSDAEDDGAFDVLPFAADPATSAGPALPELDLVADGSDELEEKELVEEGMFAEAQAHVATQPRAAASRQAALAGHEPIRLELVLDASQLPERVRQALALLGEERLRIPATVTIELAKPAK